MLKLRYVNIKTLTRFVVIVIITTKLSNFFRKIYIYMLSKFEFCVVIQKVAIVVLLSITLDVLTKTIKIIIPISLRITIPIPLRVTIFMPLRRNCRHRHHDHRRNTLFICMLSIIIIKHQYFETILISLIVDLMHTYICIYNSKYFI